MSNVTGLPNLGQTYHGGTPDSYSQSIGLEGSESQFKNVDASSPGVQIASDGRMITARLVRNSSGGELIPGRSVIWDASYRGTRVSGMVSSTNGEIAGVVDPNLNSNVASNDLFWIIRKGPCTMAIPVDSNVTAGDLVGGVTAAASTSTTAGRVAPITATTTALPVGQEQNLVGRVLVSATTASEAEVDLDIRS